MLKKMIGLLCLLPALAWATSFVEGKDYQVLVNPQLIETKPSAYTVTEFFSYGCPWCYKLEGTLDTWMGKKGKVVQLERVPVIFKPEWELYAKAYYTAKTLSMTDKLNPLLFKTIQDEKKPLNTKQSMIDFFTSQGIDKEIAKSAFENSSTIDLKVNNGMNLMSKYQINAVPAFVVNNKYKTDLQMAGSPERLFEVLDYLLKK